MSTSERRNFWIGLMGVILLALAAWGLASLAWRYLAAIPQVNATVITALVAFVTSLSTLVVTKKWDRKREIQQEHRKQKTPLYEEFIAFLFRLLMVSKTGSAIKEEETLGALVKFTQGLTIWGSNDVIQKFGEFRRLSGTNPDGVELMAAIEDILFSIRVDLGHPAGLGRGDLLRLFINDIDKLTPGS